MGEQGDPLITYTGMVPLYSSSHSPLSTDSTTKQMKNTLPKCPPGFYPFCPLLLRRKIMHPPVIIRPPIIMLDTMAT